MTGIEKKRNTKKEREERSGKEERKERLREGDTTVIEKKKTCKGWKVVRTQARKKERK